MLKGSTKIILTNVETGEQEIHEDKNLITNAIDKIININMAMNIAPNSYLLPIATKLLGGIMLFDGELTEDPDNIHFPVEAHLLGYADQNTNTNNIYRGSYNASESGKTETGFVSVWDFGTSQANGEIKSVARTSYFAGANPLRYFDSDTVSETDSGAQVTDVSWYPIRYDGEYLYMLKGNSSTHVMRLARVKIPMLQMGVADYSGVGRAYEVIASWDTEVFNYTYYTNRGTSSQRTYDVTVYADSPIMYEDGQDGNIYCMFLGPYSGRDTDYDYDINYFTIKYSDGSFDKSGTVRLRAGTGSYANNGDGRYPGRTYGHVNHGNLYLLGSGRKTIHIIPLNNPAAYRTTRIIADESEDYIASLMRCSPVNGGVYFYVYHYTNTSYEYRNGYVYPDGVFMLTQVAGAYQDRYWTSMMTIDPGLTMWYTGSSSSGSYDRVRRGWVSNYLGTINNLATPIVKTSAQTMKIVYTLTDVDDPNEAEEDENEEAEDELSE